VRRRDVDRRQVSKMVSNPPLHYLIEPLPNGDIAVWRTSSDGTKVYSATEITPVESPPPMDPLTLLLQAMADIDDMSDDMLRQQEMPFERRRRRATIFRAAIMLLIIAIGAFGLSLLWFNH
jgi:hypothetical protein